MLANLTKMLVFLTNKERNMKRPLGYEVRTLARMMKQRIDDTEFIRMNEQMTGMQGWVLGYFTRHDGEEIFQRDLEAEFRVRRQGIVVVFDDPAVHGSFRCLYPKCLVEDESARTGGLYRHGGAIQQGHAVVARVSVLSVNRKER